MRRIMSGVGVCLAALTLSACAGAAPEPLFTIDQARTIGISTPEDAELVEASFYDADNYYTADGVGIAEYLAAQTLADATDPAQCADIAVPLAIPSSDDGSTDTMFAPGGLVFGEGDEGGVVFQRIRYFASVEAATSFLADYRAANEKCGTYRVSADAGPLEVKQSVSNLPAGGIGFVVTQTWEGAGVTASEGSSFYIRQGNVIASVSGGGFVQTSVAVEAVADAIASRLSGKFEDVPQAEGGETQVANQSVAEACQLLAADLGQADAEQVMNAYLGDSDTTLDGMVAAWDSALGSVTNETVSTAGTGVSVALQEMAEYAVETGGVYTTEMETVYLDAVGEAVSDLGAVDATCSSGLGSGWSMGGDE